MVLVLKAPYLEMKLGKEGIAAMQGIKQAFDPNNIMNPGKMFAKDTRKEWWLSNDHIK